jgi:tetratricopeptide (TPR) repeat protein
VEVRAISRILSNRIFLLAVLTLLTFGVFVLTRRVAAREEQLEARIAAVWYERGEQLITSGKVEQAIQAFRRATAEAGGNQQYRLALANALAASNHDAEAQQLLLQLRETDPENIEINTYLARLAANQGKVDEAIHYYQNALYGRWTGDHADERRRKLRTELIGFLLQHQQRELAASELLILEARIPDDAASHIKVAKLFVEAGDLRRAFNNYAAAANLDSHNLDALTGAGEMAFQLGDYGKAVDYLRSALEADPSSEKTRQLLTQAELVRSEDPLEPHLSVHERQARLLEDFDRSLRRLQSCLEQTADSKAIEQMQSLRTEADAMRAKLTQKPKDFDTVRSGAALIFRIEEAASATCGQGSPEDQALLLIGRSHQGMQP